jgi:putative SOS response-associated peptidase YedK
MIGPEWPHVQPLLDDDVTGSDPSPVQSLGEPRRGCRAQDAIFPGHDSPVVKAAADGERELVQMSWGFVLPQLGKAPRRVTNTRDDKARESRLLFAFAGVWRRHIGPIKKDGPSVELDVYSFMTTKPNDALPQPAGLLSVPQ